MSKNHKWTNDEFNIALAMLDAGKSSREIGAALGRTKNSVIGRMHRHGKPGGGGKNYCLLWKPKASPLDTPVAAPVASAWVPPVASPRCASTPGTKPRSATVAKPKPVSKPVPSLATEPTPMQSLLPSLKPIPAKTRANNSDATNILVKIESRQIYDESESEKENAARVVAIFEAAPKPAGMVSFWELDTKGYHSCRRCTGDPKDLDAQIWCGAPTLPGSSWCGPCAVRLEYPRDRSRLARETNVKALARARAI